MNPTSPDDPKGEAGSRKPQLQLIPPALNLETAKALAHGAAKYGPWNWRTARVETMTYIGAIRRHLDAFLDGEDLDESGAHHLGHIAASCAIVLDAKRIGMLVDNRPPKTQWVHCGMVHLKGDPCAGCHTYEDGTKALL